MTKQLDIRTEQNSRGKWRRRLGCIVIIVVLGFLGLNVIAYRHASAMMHFKGGKPRTELPESLSIAQKLSVLFSGVSIPRPCSSMPATVLGPKTISILIPEHGNIKLGAWYCPGSAHAPLVILFHGYSAEKSGLVPEAKVFQSLGCAVLLLDFRGSGDSSESYTTVGYFEADDVAATVRFARKTLQPPKIILYGQSMGAAAILGAVARDAVAPDAIIVEAVFDRLLTTVKHRFVAMGVPSFPSAALLVFWGGEQAGFNGFRHNPVDYASSVRCPILFLHGDSDPRAHVDEGRRVYDAVPGAKRFKEFSNVGHAAGIVSHPEEWTDTVAQFLRTNGITNQPELRDSLHNLGK